MPIEKLSFTVPNDWTLNDQTNYLQKKLNELIDAFNTREQDRSEQMGRIVDKIKNIDNDLNSISREQTTYGTELCNHTFRLNALELKLENATQPKKEELPKINECHTDACEVMSWSFMSDQNEWIIMYKVDCICCGPRPGTLYKTKQEAIAAWNLRK